MAQAILCADSQSPRQGMRVPSRLLVPAHALSSRTAVVSAEASPHAHRSGLEARDPKPRGRRLTVVPNDVVHPGLLEAGAVTRPAQGGARMKLHGNHRTSRTRR